jgi:hypothetical protein
MFHVRRGAIPVFGTLSRIFKKSSPAAKEAPVAPPPNTPLEILVPAGAALSEPPKFAGKLISYLVAAASDTVSIDIELESRHTHATDIELNKFLELVAGASQSEAFVAQCKAVMYSPSEANSIGRMACIQQGMLYSFSVFEQRSLPKLKWEFRRSERPIVV